MKVLLSRALTWSIALAFATVFVVGSSAAQTSATNASDHVMRERIATIFQETLKRGEFRVEREGQLPVTARTFFPPTTEHLEEVRHYGEDAIPILADYLVSGYGFEKYLAMHFLGAIGGKSIIDPLRRVAIDDPSPSFRSTALRWLSTTPWDLAAPIIRQAAENDSSEDVRSQAREILAKHKD